MTKSEKLLEMISELQQTDERFFQHTYNRMNRKKTNPMPSNITFTHPSSPAEEKAFGKGSLIHHNVKNGITTHTHVVKKSIKNPSAFEHHFYVYHTSGNNKGAVKSHTISGFHTESDAKDNANRSKFDRFVKRATHSAVSAIKQKASDTVTKDAPTFAKHVLKHMAKSVFPHF